jgi:hypothetical protein
MEDTFKYNWLVFLFNCNWVATEMTVTVLTHAKAAVALHNQDGNLQVEGPKDLPLEITANKDKVKIWIPRPVLLPQTPQPPFLPLCLLASSKALRTSDLSSTSGRAEGG